MVVTTTFAKLDEWQRKLRDGSRADEMFFRYRPEAHGPRPLPLRAWASRGGEES